MSMKKKQENDLSKKRYKNADIKNVQEIKHTKKFPNMVSSVKMNNFISHDDSFTTGNMKKGQYLYYKQDVAFQKPIKYNYHNLNDVPIQKKYPTKLAPIVIEVQKEREEYKHEYIFPVQPISTLYFPRCTTAYNASNFGQFNNMKFREYKQLKNIFDSHNLNKYKYVLDPIFYYSDDTLKKEIDQNYRSYIHYLRHKKNKL
ncbi:hypothetical protein NGRA_0277 [Nosema granulosis]|uniref:Uncharacterized protein n=1 Tax=Nosema granulosis TaxID=83296 RepID=A0A9P6L0G9_9MICR|nr:hypothetical protein NGRA_0277 [Nosema granulosis]